MNYLNLTTSYTTKFPIQLHGHEGQEQLLNNSSEWSKFPVTVVTWYSCSAQSPRAERVVPGLYLLLDSMRNPTSETSWKCCKWLAAPSMWKSQRCSQSWPGWMCGGVGGQKYWQLHGKLFGNSFQDQDQYNFMICNYCCFNVLCCFSRSGSSWLRCPIYQPPDYKARLGYLEFWMNWILVQSWSQMLLVSGLLA